SSLVSGKRDRRSPPPPSALTSAASATSLSIAWTAPRSGKPRGYDLYLDGGLASRTRATRATISGLTCGRTYLVEVEADDAAGNRSQKKFVEAGSEVCPGGGGGGGGGGGVTVANLWVDGNGGSCTRSAAAVPYNDAAACA